MRPIHGFCPERVGFFENDLTNLVRNRLYAINYEQIVLNVNLHFESICIVGKIWSLNDTETCLIGF